jgi:hypothetical protein
MTEASFRGKVLLNFVTRILNKGLCRGRKADAALAVPGAARRQLALA